MKERNKKLIADAKKQLQSGIRMRQRQIQRDKEGKESRWFDMHLALSKIKQYQQAAEEKNLNLMFEAIRDIYRERKMRATCVSKELVNVLKRLGKACKFTPEQIELKMIVY